jgi:CRISPR/Cas system-associated endonuclease/helicase Cas3
MNLFFIYLLYQFNSIYISSKQTIYQLPYTTLNENLYLQHKQGTKLEILLSRIDQQTPFSWFNQNFLDMKPSSTRQILTKNPSLITYLPNNQMEAHLYSDIVMIGDNKLYFHFYVPISRKDDHLN